MPVPLRVRLSTPGPLPHMPLFTIRVQALFSSVRKDFRAAL